MLEIGEKIRYQGLGAGQVTDHTVRDFFGQEREFANIYFYFNDVKAQIPIGDPETNKKISILYNKKELIELLEELNKFVIKLPRTWDLRKTQCKNYLNSSHPEKWLKVIASYAYAEGFGVRIVDSDEELLEKALGLFSSELACSKEVPFKEALHEVKQYYKDLANSVSKNKPEKIDNFAAINVETS